MSACGQKKTSSVLAFAAWVALAAVTLPATAWASLTAGVNLSGLEENAAVIPGVPNVDYPVPSDAELAYYQSKGITLVRLPILWERLQPNLLDGAHTHPFDPTYLGLITSFLSLAATRQMQVIIDLHDYGAYSGSRIGGGALTVWQFAGFWKGLARVLLRSKGAAGFDLMNEPNHMPNAQTWPFAAQAAVAAIRTADQHTPIVVEGDNWSSACGWSGANAALSITDPAQPVTYQVHVYGDADCSGTHYAWADAQAQGVTVQTIAARLADFIGWCQGRQCMIGEVGVGNDDANWNTQLATGLAAAQAGGLRAFTYWAAGPWWGSYPMSIEPTALNGQGVDALQMAIVAPYGALPGRNSMPRHARVPRGTLLHNAAEAALWPARLMRQTVPADP